MISAHPRPAHVAVPKIVEKPWGREIWYAHEERYAGKVLEVSTPELDDVIRLEGRYGRS